MYTTLELISYPQVSRQGIRKSHNYILVCMVASNCLIYTVRSLNFNDQKVMVIDLADLLPTWPVSI